jgi:uncharacterized protein YbjT (DUF2867 family)
MSNLFFVGATGGLGMEVAPGLVTATGFDDKIALVRSESDKTKRLADLGWHIVVVDFDDAAALQESMKGVKVVVSTMSGGNIKEAEITVMSAAKAAGATLYVPSQFSLDYRRWNGSFPFFEGKVAALKHAESLGLPILSVFPGSFSDGTFHFLADTPNRKATLIDGGKTMYSFTRRSDIGYVLAKALANPKYNQGGFLSMQAETLPYKDALALVEEVAGFKFTITDLTAEEGNRVQQDLLSKGDMGSLFGAFAMHLLVDPVSSGSTGLDVSAEADNHGHPMESLRTTIEKTIGKR